MAHIRIPYDDEPDPPPVGELSESDQHPKGWCARCDADIYGGEQPAPYLPVTGEDHQNTKHNGN